MFLEFFNDEGNDLRAIEKDGEPWVVAKDVCDALGIKNSRQALKDLDEDEKNIFSNDTLGGKQKISFINESGLYALIFKSRKIKAREFQKWVTKEVLPSIRKTGFYSVKDMNEEYKLAFGCGEAAGYFGKERYYLAHKIMEKHGSKMPEKYHEDLDYHLEGSTVVNDFIKTKKINKGKRYSRDEMFKEFKEYVFERFGASFSTFKGTLKSLGVEYVNTRKKKFFIKRS